MALHTKNAQAVFLIKGEKLNKFCATRRLSSTLLKVANKGELFSFRYTNFPFLSECIIRHKLEKLNTYYKETGTYDIDINIMNMCISRNMNLFNSNIHKSDKGILHELTKIEYISQNGIARTDDLLNEEDWQSALSLLHTLDWYKEEDDVFSQV